MSALGCYPKPWLNGQDITRPVDRQWTPPRIARPNSVIFGRKGSQ
jgi:hypothetical protein